MNTCKDLLEYFTEHAELVPEDDDTPVVVLGPEGQRYHIGDITRDDDNVCLCLADVPEDIDCETQSCAYNRDGICRFSRISGHGPTITDEDGCVDGVIDPAAVC